MDLARQREGWTHDTAEMYSCLKRTTRLDM